MAFERRPQGYQTTNWRLKLLVNDRKEIRNESVSHQHFPLRMQIKSSVMVGAVFVSLNLSISGRGDVEFQRNSDALDTHNSNTQGGLKPCVCM